MFIDTFRFISRNIGRIFYAAALPSLLLCALLIGAEFMHPAPSPPIGGPIRVAPAPVDIGFLYRLKILISLSVTMILAITAVGIGNFKGLILAAASYGAYAYPIALLLLSLILSIFSVSIMRTRLIETTSQQLPLGKFGIISITFFFYALSISLLSIIAFVLPVIFGDFIHDILPTTVPKYIGQIGSLLLGVIAMNYVRLRFWVGIAAVAKGERPHLIRDLWFQGKRLVWPLFWRQLVLVIVLSGIASIALQLLPTLQSQISFWLVIVLPVIILPILGMTTSNMLFAEAYLRIPKSIET